nr:hypothetical protein GCM10025730_46530 [Promicromonospora thailandica]
MSNPWVVAAATVVIIALSAFFVAVEFALLAAKRHRLEDAAPTSRSARAALRSSGELTVLLAGSQLGITVCTLALGAITKPAVHHWLTPLFETWGAPSGPPTSPASRWPWCWSRSCTWWWGRWRPSRGRSRTRRPAPSCWRCPCGRS